MKKNTLFFLVLSLSIWQLQAQLSQGFEGPEGSFPPSGWTISDNSVGTTINWESSSDSFSGDKAAFIDYDLTGLTEDWLISPIFTPNSSNNILTFYQKQDSSTPYGSIYTVRVNNLTDGGGYVIENSQVESDFGIEYSLKEIDLSNYNGKNIQIAFVLTQNDGDSWYIDNVSTINPTGEVPNCVINHAPIDNSLNVVNLASEVFLSWDAPSTGVVPSSYDVYVGLSDPPTLKVAETGKTNYTLLGASYAETYYWKIVPKNYLISATSCTTRSFTTQVENTSPPINDSCETAISISETPYENTQDATHATNNYPLDGGFVWECDGGSIIGGMNDGVWYTFTTILGGTVNIDITNVSSAFNVEVAVYSGTCGNFTCTGFKDTAATGAGSSESLSIVVDDGKQYWINIGSNSASIDETEGAFKITMSLEAGVTLGVDDLDTKLNVNLYPNPTNGILNLKFKDNIDMVHVFNLLGQEVKSVFPNRDQTKIDMSNLPSGMYIVEIRSKDKKGSYRVIKQ